MAFASSSAASIAFRSLATFTSERAVGRGSGCAETFVLPLAYAAIGFTPIGALALSIVGIVPLSTGALLLVGLGLLASVALAYHFPAQSRVALEGFTVGVAAVLAYDAARWLTISLGWWGDFIPSIGGWLLGTNEPNVLLGYLYRWAGDGGGMGLAFLVLARALPFTPTRSPAVAIGIAYGIAIWVCLLLTLLVAPTGQQELFVLTPVTLLLSLGGHIIYGIVLGAWLARTAVPSRQYR
ncbi:MAG: hypothetical protein M3336_03220 [Chloroflexota bacterium]|nr:hypothetical protein [Chloroflexota bacterium]